MIRRYYISVGPWRVVLELIRMLRTFTPEQRKMLMIHGLFIERNKL